MRFHFNVYDGVEHADPDGTELPDLVAARKHAIRYFGEMLHGEPSTFWNGEAWKMECTDESGLVLFSLHLVGIDSPAVSGLNEATENMVPASGKPLSG